MKEQTFLMIKPDKNGNLPNFDFEGYIASKLPKTLKIEMAKKFMWSREGAEAHYAEHKGKPFYEGLIEMITNGPCVGFIISGEGAVDIVRNLAGSKADCVDGECILPEKNSLRYEIPIIDLYLDCYCEAPKLHDTDLIYSFYNSQDNEVISAIRVGDKGLNVTYSKKYNWVHSSDGKVDEKTGIRSNDYEVKNFKNEMLKQPEFSENVK